MHRVLKTNESFNLTAIKDEDSFIEKMIFDSALLLSNQLYENETIVDIGTGAGFPSVVLAILSPLAHIIALDSTAKKIKFIDEFVKEKNLNLEAVSTRAEDYALEHREEYALVTARAVSSLRVLVELSAPMLRCGGHLIAMKGPDFENEIKDAESALKKLRCTIDYIYEDQLPVSLESRYFVYVKKLGPTPTKYPRSFGEIKNKPL
jgi:16S rRNA (guanine527-N7)-methyltransferase